MRSRASQRSGQGADRQESNQESGRQKTARQALRTQTFVCGWDFELRARAAGALHVAGVDEVGCGPLFGPVVAAAVILVEDFVLEGLTDSKKLKPSVRETFDGSIRAGAVAFAIAEVDAETIDRINIRQAARLAMRMAVERLGVTPDHLLIDGNMRIDHACSQQTIVKGDGQSLSIAAASVLAKVYRDRLMRAFDEQFPGYGLAQHKGYATAAHREALRRLGPTPLHRKSFLHWEADVALGLLTFAEDDMAVEDDQPKRGS